MFAIETDGLAKSFGGKPAVDELMLQVPDRCVYGFLGPNGAGKTTTMRLLLGLLKPDRGTIRLLGHDLAGARRAALAGVGAFVESPSLYDHLSGRTNLDLTRRLLRLGPREVDRVLEVVDLRTAADARAGTYSLGMKQRLALARTLLGSPRLLLLDEPTNGLDPDGIVAMRELIRALPDRIGGTVFMSSHLLSEVEQIVTVAGVMRDGRLVLQGQVSALIGDGHEVRIELDDAERGTALLGASGFRATALPVAAAGGGAAIRMTCSAADAVRAEAARANRILVDAGFAVSAVVPQAPTLEQVYRRSTAAATGTAAS